MRKYLLAVAFAVAQCLDLHAQVSVEVRFDQDQFLPGEALVAAVRITNRSGQTLRLGVDPDWLTFSIESKDGFIIAKEGEAPVTGAFDLESSSVATKEVDVSPYFKLMKPGRYDLIATVKIKNWNTQLSSPPKGFDIIQGSRLWEKTFGIPNTGTNTTREPELRKYILQEANYLRTQLRLYLRVTDSSESTSYRVYAIGPMISMSKPEPQLDQQSNLHVLYQNGPRSFSYTKFNPYGEVLLHQTYDYSGSRPRLNLDDKGQIVVSGGVRHPMLDDIPRPNAPSNDFKPPKAPPQAPQTPPSRMR
jgi:hypothetical protein